MWERDTTLNIGSHNNTASKNLSIVRGLAYHRRVYRLLENWRLISAPDQVLYIEPWLRHYPDKQKCQPDAVLIEPQTETGIVIEAKLNWKDGRDEKLLDLYLTAVCEAFGLRAAWPALITSNVRGLKYKPLLGLGGLQYVDSWNIGNCTPVILVP